MQVELRAEKKALLVGDTITIHCVARNSEILEDHWKYPGKLVRQKQNKKKNSFTSHSLKIYIKQTKNEYILNIFVFSLCRSLLGGSRIKDRKGE